MEYSLCNTAKRDTTETSSSMSRQDDHVKAIPGDIDNRIDYVTGPDFYRDFEPDLFKPRTSLP